MAWDETVVGGAARALVPATAATTRKEPTSRNARYPGCMVRGRSVLAVACAAGLLLASGCGGKKAGAPPAPVSQQPPQATAPKPKTRPVHQALVTVHVLDGDTNRAIAGARVAMAGAKRRSRTLYALPHRAFLEAKV